MPRAAPLSFFSFTGNIFSVLLCIPLSDLPDFIYAYRLTDRPGLSPVLSGQYSAGFRFHVCCRYYFRTELAIIQSSPDSDNSELCPLDASMIS